MSMALNATGRPILYSMCNWGEDGPWNFAVVSSSENTRRTRLKVSLVSDHGEQLAHLRGHHRREWFRTSHCFVMSSLTSFMIELRPLR
jgi:hypothetical protein